MIKFVCVIVDTKEKRQKVKKSQIKKTRPFDRLAGARVDGGKKITFTCVGIVFVLLRNDDISRQPGVAFIASVAQDRSKKGAP